MALMTLKALSTNKTSMGKCIKKVWMELQDVITRASPCLKSFVPSNPLARLNRVAAIITFSAKTVFFVLLIIFTFQRKSDCVVLYVWAGGRNMLSGIVIPFNLISSIKDGMCPVA